MNVNLVQDMSDGLDWIGQMRYGCDVKDTISDLYVICCKWSPFNDCCLMRIGLDWIWILNRTVELEHRIKVCVGMHAKRDRVTSKNLQKFLKKYRYYYCSNGGPILDEISMQNGMLW